MEDESQSRPESAKSRSQSRVGSAQSRVSSAQSRVSSAKSEGAGSRAASAKSRASIAGSILASRPASAKSAALSRQGSARSHKSVAWSTVDDEQNLLEDEPSKKQGALTQIISGMWASREMLVDNHDPQLYVKITLRELITYSIFMVVICYGTFVQYSPTYYTYTSMMKSLFTKQLDVTNMQLFWRFLEEDLVDGIYWETWYNKGQRNTQIRCPTGEPAKQPCVVPPADRNIMYENRVLGLPRLRQLKVTNDSCNIQEDFQKAIKVCYAPYSSSSEDSRPFFPDFRNFSDESAWVYHTEEALEGTPHWGQLTTYSGAGYYQNLHYLKNDSTNIIRELKEGLWITQGTRFVTIDFTVYNVNINLFCVAKLTFEFPATGGVIPEQDFTAVKLLKYTESSDYVLMACEIIFVIFIVYYIIEESLEIKRKKFRYFFNFWNILDLIVIGISGAQIFYNIYLIFSVDGVLEQLLKKPFKFADFSFLASNARTLTVLSALNVFVAWIKVFKYLSFNKTMTQLSGTLGAAAKDLSGFSVMFFIIFSAFVQLGYLLFGTQVRDFRSFIDSVFTLFRMILGDFNFRDIEKANAFLGPVYFLSYIFFVFFVLLNMFLAIINDTYGEVKADLKTKKPDFQMSDFFKTGVNNVKGYLGIHDRAIDVENAIKLAAADDGFVTYEGLRENLRKARFSDVEIDLFFHQFQSDPMLSQIILDEEEVRAKQEEREKRRLSRISGIFDSDDDDLGFESDEEIQAPRSGREARRARSARIRSNLEDQSVPDNEFYQLVGRVDRMESSIAPLASKIDIVMARFGASNPAEKKLKKADMERMFDQILQSDNDDGTKCNQMEELVHNLEASRPSSQSQRPSSAMLLDQ
ncbi:hypothetical protein TCAL_04863 [Tigriopus californicus]|uniref:Uncharacterized protein n=1 Tax=Tigriopus californicus TaxID=6832 RepID=A0A553PRU9_TIGCA|nr:hypothetical protein TCAL_04863 [Tigriopus californicus]